MTLRKKLSWAVLIVFCWMALPQVTLASDLSDLDNHWAKNSIEEWVDGGFVTGYSDGKFYPNQEITRAEFVVLVNRILGFYQEGKTDFIDVHNKGWFYRDIGIAQKAGYIAGYDDGTFRPGKKISRQEAAVILARLWKIDGTEGKDNLNQFTDASEIAGWSKGAVRGVVSNKYMNGYPNGTFQADRAITRAETVTVLNNALGTLLSQSGIEGPETGIKTIEGNVTLIKAGIKLRNMVINGDLFLAAGIGDGNAELDQVTVKGRVLVAGGGENSIIFNNCSVQSMIVYRVEGKVRVIAAGTTDVDRVYLESLARLEEGEGLSGKGFSKVTATVLKPGGILDLDGNFDEITIDCLCQINISGSTRVEKLTLGEKAAGAAVSMENGAHVTNLVLNGATNITGAGTIEQASINASDVNIQPNVKKFSLGGGIPTAIIGGKTVTGSQEPISGGGGGGSGGSGTVDKEAPVITLLGDSEVYVEIGSAYLDAGATALDNQDGDITDKIEINDIVNVNKVGTYTVTYNVKDIAGNPALEVTRTVRVIEKAIEVTAITVCGATDVIGTQVEIPIRFSYGLGVPKNMAGGQMILRFNPELVQAVNVRASQLVLTHGMLETNINQPGIVRIAWAADKAISEEGIICTVSWKLKQKGTTSLVIEDLLFNDVDGEKIIITGIDGKIDIID